MYGAWPNTVRCGLWVYMALGDLLPIKRDVPLGGPEQGPLKYETYMGVCLTQVHRWYCPCGQVISYF